MKPKGNRTVRRGAAIGETPRAAARSGDFSTTTSKEWNHG